MGVAYIADHGYPRELFGIGRVDVEFVLIGLGAICAWSGFACWFFRGNVAFTDTGIDDFVLEVCPFLVEPGQVELRCTVGVMFAFSLNRLFGS